MRERNELSVDRFSPSHSEGIPSREFAEPGAASGHPAAGPAQPAHVGRSRRSGAHLAACLIGSLLIALAMLAAPASSSARFAVGISVSFGPPALPIYSQPFCPGPGYIWTPGYWAWDQDYGYYWVPGTWVMAPFPGALWTPGYWAYDDGVYVWNEGYWGPVVGYYGGIFYGFGYTGYGYEGGYWNQRRFYYNRSVNNIQTTNITNVYNKTVVNNVDVTRVSYSGGPGGMEARPTAAQIAAANQRRSGPVAEQMQHIQTAERDPRLRASENKGRPAVAATPRPGQFSGREIVQASRAGAPYQPPEPKAAGANRSAPNSMPAGAPSPAARPGKPPEATAPRRAEPPERVGHPAPAVERPAPAQVEPPQPKYQRSGPPPEQAHPNVTRVPMERQPAPRAESGRPVKQTHPPEKRGGGEEHKPDKSHD